VNVRRLGAACLLLFSCASLRHRIARVFTGEEAPELPQAIRVKTPTRTFNSFFYYALDPQGRIWVKSIPGASKETEELFEDWTLLQETGLPNDPRRKDFVTPKRIASINADQDELMAVSDDHRHYSMRWFENPVFKEETPAKVWADLHGWPVSGPFIWDARVKDNRSWAVGRRTRNIAVFEDVLGRTFDGGGGLSTYYFLAAGGAQVSFSDSGLPPDFSHTVCGPDRSTFIAEAMQVAADTIFLINAYGELRTRLFDFDAGGSDTMFFRYTYDHAHPAKDTIALPSEDWFAHKPVPLEGQAQISTQIAIALTGKHNRDRELRVAGYDRDRHPGIWSKRIFSQADGSPERRDDDDWKFVEDPGLTIDPMALLDPADTDPEPARAQQRAKVETPRWAKNEKPPRRGPEHELSYEGELRSADQRLEARVQVSGFSIECSPATVTLSIGDDSADFVLHTVEKWTHLPRFDPGHDSTPKEYLATLERPAGAAEPKTEALRGLVREVLSPHLVDFGFFAQATEDYLELDSRPSDRGVPRLVLSLGRPGRHYPSLTAAKQDALRHESFTARAQDPSLRVERPLAQLQKTDVALLRQKIADNERVERELADAYDWPDRVDRGTPQWLSPAVMGALKFATGPSMIRLILPAMPFRNVEPSEASYYAKNLVTNLPPLLVRSREVNSMLQRYARRDLEHAQMLLRTRVSAYELEAAQLEGLMKVTPFTFAEDLAGYWEPLKFGEQPARVKLRIGARGLPPCTWSVDDRPIFEPERRTLYARRPGPAGLFVTARCGPEGRSGGLLFRVVPTQLEADAFRASLDPRPGDPPFQTPVVAQLESEDLTSFAENVAMLVPGSGRDPWDEELTGTLSVRGGQWKLTTRAVDIEWSH
jgi:hypothetical protein